MGDLEDALANLNDTSLGTHAVADFEKVKAEKDGLKPFPEIAQERIDTIRKHKNKQN